MEFAHWNVADYIRVFKCLELISRTITIQGPDWAVLASILCLLIGNTTWLRTHLFVLLEKGNGDGPLRNRGLGLWYAPGSTIMLMIQRWSCTTGFMGGCLHRLAERPS